MTHAQIAESIISKLFEDHQKLQYSIAPEFKLANNMHQQEKMEICIQQAYTFFAQHPFLKGTLGISFTGMFESDKLVSFGIMRKSKKVSSVEDQLGCKFAVYADDDEKNPYDPNIHAEVDALLQFKKAKGLNVLETDSLANVDVFNVRLNGNMNSKNSCPCCNCLHLLKKFGFKELYFNDSAGNVCQIDKNGSNFKKI